MSRQEVEQRIIDNENLVYFMVHKYFPDLCNDDDIIQCGRIGLWKASEHYDDSRGKFSTFASKCIINEIKNELRSRYREKEKARVISLDYVVGVDKESDMDIPFGHTVPCIEDGYYKVDCDLPAIEEKIPEQKAQVLKMYIYGFSPSEISKAFGFSRTWASNLIRDARRIVWKELFL